MAPRAPPTHIAPSLNRAKLRTLKAILWPLPTSPSRFSAGTLTSCRITGVVDDPCRPILCSSLPLDTPGNARSTMNALKCSPGSVDHLAEDDVDVGEAAVGDPHLLAVQHEAAVGLRASPASCAPSASDPEPGSLRQ